MKEKNEKDSFHAKVAFWLSLGFWIPLFNIGLCIISIYYAYQAIKRIENDPKRYGGRGLATAAMIISITAIILTTVGIILYAIQRIKEPLT